jgi:hypothetical protein
MKAWKAAAAVTVLAAAALVPLYGDPRATRVTHSEWARLLLRALEMGDVLAATGQASQAFSILSWKSSLDYKADHYLRASGVTIEGRPRRLVAGETPGEAVYPLAVVRGGDYKLRLRLSGRPDSPADADVTPIGATTPVKAFRVVPAAAMGWVEAGVVHLDPGSYTTSIAMPPGTHLEEVEVAPPCLNPIEPPGGWRATAPALDTDIAVTAIKAVDKESELPASDTAVEVHGDEFQVAPGSASVRRAADGPEALWLRAGPMGLQAMVFVEAPEPGLYAVSAFGIEGGGQSWLADSCRKAVVCAPPLPGRNEPVWRAVMTAELAAGRHFFTVVLGPGAAVERLRIERKKNTPQDYLETIRRLGYDPGPEGPVTRAKAVEAMEWIRGHRHEGEAQTCGDVVLVASTTGSGGAQGLPGPVTTPPAQGGPPPLQPPGGPGQPPIGSPPIPPQQPGSPVSP